MSIAKFEKELRRWIRSDKAPGPTEIARETGISRRWLQYYKNRDKDGVTIENPSLRNLVALWDYKNRCEDK